MQNDPIRVTNADLNSPQVEEFLAMRRELQRAIGEIEPQSLFRRVFYSSWFYLGLSSALGAFIAWLLLEPWFDESAVGEGFVLANFLIFPAVAGCAGLFLGASEGLMCRNLSRALLCGIVGLGIGFAGGMVALFPAGMVFGIMLQIAVAFWKNPQPNQMPTGFALLILMMGRAAAWAIAALPAGLGQGTALKERRVVLNGLVGGALGGLLGGLLFDPISIYFNQMDRATASRGVGFTIIGLLVGVFVGLVEGWTKSAWLMMRAGPLAGKQFVLYREATVLGSSPKAEIYLFKDDAIEPKHAILYNRGGRFEIEDCQTADGTYVNGMPVARQVLNSGDQIVLGKTVLEFHIKESN